MGMVKVTYSNLGKYFDRYVSPEEQEQIDWEELSKVTKQEACEHDFVEMIDERICKKCHLISKR